MLAGAQAAAGIAGGLGAGKAAEAGFGLMRDAAGNMLEQVQGKWVPVVGKALNEALDRAATQGLLKSGGVYGTDGKPLIDLSHLSNDQKRVMGEMFGENQVGELLPEGEKLARVQGAGENGIDDLYKTNRTDVDYVIVEYKYGTSKLKMTRDGMQMSDTWSTGATTGFNRILEAVGQNNPLAEHIQESLDHGRVERWLVHTDPMGTVSVGLLDKNGKFIPRPDMASKILGGQKP